MDGLVNFYKHVYKFEDNSRDGVPRKPNRNDYTLLFNQLFEHGAMQ